MQKGNSSRRVLSVSLATIAVALSGAAYNALRWRRSTSPDASSHAVVWFVLRCLYVVAGSFRFLYRDKRNYFAEEIARRRSIAHANRDRSQAKS
jgi:hypothetical protein